jgi:hypothetical protein
MELFHLHIESGRQLCKKIARSQPLQKATISESSGNPDTETYAVHSSILAHATCLEEPLPESIRRLEQMDKILDDESLYPSDSDNEDDNIPVTDNNHSIITDTTNK